MPSTTAKKHSCIRKRNGRGLVDERTAPTPEPKPNWADLQVGRDYRAEVHIRTLTVAGSDSTRPWRLVGRSRPSRGWKSTVRWWFSSFVFQQASSSIWSCPLGFASVTSCFPLRNSTMTGESYSRIDTEGETGWPAWGLRLVRRIIDKIWFNGGKGGRILRRSIGGIWLSFGTTGIASRRGARYKSCWLSQSWFFEYMFGVLSVFICIWRTRQNLQTLNTDTKFSNGKVLGLDHPRPARGWGWGAGGDQCPGAQVLRGVTAIRPMYFWLPEPWRDERNASLFEASSRVPAWDLGLMEWYLIGPKWWHAPRWRHFTFYLELDL